MMQAELKKKRTYCISLTQTCIHHEWSIQQVMTTGVIIIVTYWAASVYNINLKHGYLSMVKMPDSNMVVHTCSLSRHSRSSSLQMIWNRQAGADHFTPGLCLELGRYLRLISSGVSSTALPGISTSISTAFFLLPITGCKSIYSGCS